MGRKQRAGEGKGRGMKREGWRRGGKGREKKGKNVDLYSAYRVLHTSNALSSLRKKEEGRGRGVWKGEGKGNLTRSSFANFRALTILENKLVYVYFVYYMLVRMNLTG